MQLVEQRLLLVLVLWVLGHVGSQRGSGEALFWWGVMGWEEAEAKGGPDFPPLEIL